MTKLMLLAATAALLAAPALAGDPAVGEDLFKKCKACHSVIAPDGTEFQKGGRTGPNLWGMMGRPIASDPDFAYGSGLNAVATKGLVWDEALLTGYLADPAAWVVQESGDAAARSKMNFSLGEGGDDIAAYLRSIPQ